MLNFVYYPVSAIMWFWHKVFGYVFGEATGVAWALAVVFLVFSLRALLYKPFVHQVRSMRKMQEFAPEMQKLRAKYGNDKQKLTAEMQKLQSQQGVNPLGGCLPVLVQVPVFIGLFHVLREFEPGKTENYVFGASEVESFNAASLFGAKLGAWVTMGSEQLQALGTSIPEMLIVMVPLMIAAGIFTHITARHSVARQTEAQLANPQAAIMNKLMLYVFPIGVVVGAPFLPLAVLIYWVANNLWTLGQQWVVYRKIDAEEAEKKTQAVAERQARAPRPGQKPMRPEAARPGNAAKTSDAKNPDAKTANAKTANAKTANAKTANAKTADGKTPGAKPVTPRASRSDGRAAARTADTTGESADGAAPGNGASPNGAGASNPAAKGPVANDPGANGAGTKGTGASATRGRSGASRPPARRPRRRR